MPPQHLAMPKAVADWGCRTQVRGALPLIGWVEGNTGLAHTYADYAHTYRAIAPRVPSLQRNALWDMALARI